ncbi:hypothetical protein BABINDRAFT_161044 [Babjeviella inositovora NRRL Y-12698]|uniref:Increased recombination centers protein 6 n=1 Tax=Babjeviella inositovora NRRL Y-12698 TaxID=984486 RepID=A0A1E3QT33_9ASCO|nr:uncharacterized protein BABINDRAFT_161044 [Babjeviella inositovora NRRL Y-12698]ODQ80841.1 hypothetical protein BABINDRAFT_161044 [Babjeviella inositovora NRRL Y-12698]
MIDEFQDRTETNTPQAKGLTAWCTTLRDEECRELRDVLSGVVFTFNLSDSVDQIDHYGSQLLQLFETFDEDTFAADPESFGWGGIKLAVGFHRDDDPMVLDATLVLLEDIFIENGVEFVVYRETGLVSDEEGNKVGKHRIKEIFESHEWSGIDIEDKTPRERKTEDVCRSLLTDEELNLNEIISKIAKARLDTSELQTDEEKEAHAQKMVNSIMEYLG